MIAEDLKFDNKTLKNIIQNEKIKEELKGVSSITSTTEIAIRCKICGKVEHLKLNSIVNKINEEGIYEPLCGMCRMSLSKYKDNYEYSLSFVKSRPDLYNRMIWKDPKQPKLRDAKVEVKCSCGKTKLIYAKDFLKEKLYEQPFEYKCPDCTFENILKEAASYNDPLIPMNEDGTYPVSEGLKEYLSYESPNLTWIKNHTPLSIAREVNSLIKEDLPFNIKLNLIRINKKVKHCPICGEVCKTPKTNPSSFQETCGKPECIKALKERTCMEIYGATSPFKSEKIKEQIKQTNLERYGVENIFQDVDYIRKCTKEKLGVENIFEDKEYIAQCIQNKYGVTNATYVKCGAESEKILREPDLFKSFVNDHKNDDGTVPFNELATLLNVSEGCIKSKFKEFGMEAYLKQNRSSYEYSLLKYLYSIGICKDDIQVGVRSLIDKNNLLEIDLYIPSRNLGIEFNGSKWHSTLHKEPFYHQKKSLDAKNNLRVVYIYEFEWLSTEYRNKCLELLRLLTIGPDEILNMEDTVIKEVDQAKAYQFLDNYSFRWRSSSDINLGLYINDTLLEVMSFSKNKKDEYSLDRICRLPYLDIKGGHKYLLDYFVKKYKPSRINAKCYLDKETPSFYESLGFIRGNLFRPRAYHTYDGVKVFTDPYRNMDITLFKRDRENNPTNVKYIKNNSENFIIYDAGGINFYKDFN